ncbi:TetR/AcrR family transcriptional regulator [Herbaspirillum huttiense]|uniref:TetR/AcrR family transcriptional regulator n=1 Tax=Herbaspirillum huttiense TaxID=863372 RepID=UPI001064DCF9|nr:TetR/AcrR family transcriptional regulator [Herbaspirillum huttiense]QBP77680.1 TetR/AcrR family transcriptional regulator [Herbaspirillum huttiense]
MKNATKNVVEDHRTRAGIERREKTRTRLIQSAIKVFSEKGPDLPVIDDFIVAAGVARGTFYNYFKTTHELLAAVTGEMSDEILGMVDPIVLQFEDPAVRVTVGTKLYVHIATQYPTWGTFLTRIGSQHAVRGKLLDVYLTRDLELGIAEERFRAGNALVTRDIILGSIFFGIETMLTEPSHTHHIEEMLYTVLRGVGLKEKEARRIAFAPLPDIGTISGPIFSVLVSGGS